jgi:nitrogen fixation protein FixH
MREITGKKVLITTVATFGLVIGVNVFLAYSAISTFPGLEVDNSYVASQSFDADRKAQMALGWVVATHYDPQNGLRLQIFDKAGQAVDVASLDVLVGRPTEQKDDQSPQMIKIGDHYQAALDLAQGRWMLRVRARAQNGTLFFQRLGLTVQG